MSVKKYKGKLKPMPETEIYINIDNLKKGTYTLKIVNKNKVVKEIKFKKDKLI